MSVIRRNLIASYSRKAKNKNPKYQAPEHRRKRPGVIRRWQRWTEEKKLNEWIGFSLLKANGTRQRVLNNDRAKALKAVTQCLLDHLNVCTHDVHVNIEQIADYCGLSTQTSNGKSISRASRLFTDVLEPIGLVESEKIWDRNNGLWLPKHIHVTPLFFEMLGIDLEKVELERVKFQRYTQDNLLDEQQAGLLPLSELEKLSKIKHYRDAFALRKNKRQMAKKKRFAVKVKAEKERLNSTAHSRLFAEISLELASEYEAIHSKQITFQELKKLTNKRIAYLSKIAET